MKRQESSISLNKNRGLKYALCIITILCYFLSTIAQAGNIDLTPKTMTLYGLKTIDATSNTWHQVSYTYENGAIIGAFQSGSQYRISMLFQYDSIQIENADIKFKVKVKNSNISEQYNSVARLENNGTTKKDIQLNVKKVNDVYYFDGERIATTEANQLELILGITYVSSDIQIYDIEFNINNEIKYEIREWENKQQELEDALQDIEVTVDQNAIENIINNPPTIDSTINVGILTFTNETIPLYIMSLTLTLAIISFLLYGKK